MDLPVEKRTGKGADTTKLGTLEMVSDGEGDVGTETGEEGDTR